MPIFVEVLKTEEKNIIWAIIYLCEENANRVQVLIVGNQSFLNGVLIKNNS